MKTSTGIILAMSGFVCGAAIGFILSPVKKGIRVGRLNFECTMGCNNGAGNVNNRYGKKDDKKKIESEIDKDE